ncbi:MAG: O-succinylhomoserine sulfhydrylase [Gammaproteobacteria bacterium]|nr:MAG: O-succinylhomoserine sulfhydrylase [Gammaproteobacteria bacterium]
MAEEYTTETLSVRAGYDRTHQKEHSEALFLTSSFIFDDCQEASDIFSGKASGNIYSRFTNPTVACFEKRLALMEGGECCVATATGMSAISVCIQSLLSAGDHIISSQSIFGSTTVLFDSHLSRFGIKTSYVDLTDIESFKNAIQPTTKVIFIESPSNPLMEIGNIKSLSALAKQHNILLIVDNCFASPALMQPIKLGADISIQSATKSIDGHGRMLGGAIIGSKKIVGEQVYQFIKSNGSSMSAFNAWVFLNGLETLNLRMQEHSKRAYDLAKWLEKQPQVTKVYYPFLKSFDQYDLAKKQQSAGGAILSFEIKGGKKEAWDLIDNTKLFSITANHGDTKSTICHPATTTHSKISKQMREKIGIKDNLIRISTGLESLVDIKADLHF